MASDQAARLRLGVLVTVVVAGAAALIWGGRGAAAAGSFGVLATAIQLTAARLMARQGGPVGVDHLKVYLVGVFLRLAGVALVGVAIALDRERFPPGPTAMGYVGTILPLLYLETRLTR